MRKSLGTKIFDLVNGIFLVFLALVTLYPFLYVVFASVSDAALFEYNTGLLLKPAGFSLDAYKAVLANGEIWSGYRNTIFYVIVGVLNSVTMTSLGGYVLSRRDFYWNKFILPMVLVTMFFGGGLIPNYLLIRSLGMDNTVLALIIPTSIYTMNLFIMKTNFQSLPAELEESAFIDGANQWQVFIKIVLPLSKAIIAVMCLFYGVGKWNDWFSAMIYLRDRNLFPLQLVLREILILSETEDMMQGMDLSTSDMQRVSEVVKYATIVVSTVPVLMIYPFVQKYFVKGVMIGALKG